MILEDGRDIPYCATCRKTVNDDHPPEWQCAKRVCGIWFHSSEKKPVCPKCKSKTN